MAEELRFYPDGPACGVGRANTIIHAAALAGRAIKAGTEWDCKAPTVNGDCPLGLYYDGRSVRRQESDGTAADNCPLQPRPRSDTDYLKGISGAFDNLGPHNP